MTLQDKLQIVLITYNRKKYLKRTLDEILAEGSPIRDFSITILDNASTDGTSELIDEYCTKFPNITHIRHKINIGGCANVCRGYEYGVSSGKEYVWVLCDDDRYDFSNWKAVEDLVNKKTDIICVSNYSFPTEKDQQDLKYQLFQLTFVPALICRAELITDNVMMNMYNGIYTMFQSPCIVISAINKKKQIKVLSQPIVFNGFQSDDACTDVSYTRGLKKGESILDRTKNNQWVLGYANILSLLNNKSIMTECFETAIVYKDICNSWKNFYDCLGVQLGGKDRFNYFYEVYHLLSDARKREINARYASAIQLWLKQAGFPVRMTLSMRASSIQMGFKRIKLFVKIKTAALKDRIRIYLKRKK